MTARTAPGSEPMPLRHHLDALLEAVGPLADKAIADVGCGTAWLARALARRDARPIAVDPQWALLRESSARPAVAAHAQSLPIRDRALDGAVLFNSLHHVPEAAMAGALAELARVVRHGGWVYVAEPLAAGPFFDLVRLVDDETAVRAAAQAALADAANGEMQLRAEGRYDHAVVYATADDFLKRLIGVDPARTSAVARRESALRSGFDATGEPTAEGMRFRHPTRWHLFSV